MPESSSFAYGPHWSAAHAAAAQAAVLAGRLKTSDLVRLDRWFRQAAARPGAPGVDDFVAFGRLSTLERLRPALSIVAPQDVGPLRLALRRRRVEKRLRLPARRTGRQRGPTPEFSVPATSLPQHWQDALQEMTIRRRRIDAGFVFMEAAAPPAKKQIGRISYTMRSLAAVCVQQKLPIVIEAETVAAWLDECEKRNRRPSGLSAQIGQIRTFLR
jgi:hypothetical protein